MELPDIPEFVSNLVVMIFAGGTSGIIAILVLVIIFLFLDRRRIIREIDAKDERYDLIVEEYHAANVGLATGLSDLKAVLYDIRVAI